MRWLKRSRPAPQGTLRLGNHSDQLRDYSVFTVSESRFPASFEQLWTNATDDERQTKHVRRWAVLTPVVDPKSSLIADLAAEIDGQCVCYLRPPHLTFLAQRIIQENVETLEVPALVEWGPAGPTVMLLIEIS